MGNVFDEMGNYWAEIADKAKLKSKSIPKNPAYADGYVLDVACGTGRHTIPLSQDGYDVGGLGCFCKPSHNRQKRVAQVQVVRGDMRFLPFKAERSQL